MSGVPDPTPVGVPEAAAANGAPSNNSGNASAMQLFAPDPNAGPDQVSSHTRCLRRDRLLWLTLSIAILCHWHLH